MHILVLLKMVPDVVEDLEIASDGRALDLDYLRMILSESDDHALEQALLLKERHGAKVTVLAVDAAEVDDALFAAAAKGADRVMKVVGCDAGLSTRAGRPGVVADHRRRAWPDARGSDPHGRPGDRRPGRPDRAPRRGRSAHALPGHHHRDQRWMPPAARLERSKSIRRECVANSKSGSPRSWESRQPRNRPAMSPSPRSGRP